MIFIAYGANLPSKAGHPEQTYLSVLGALRGYGIQVIRQSSLWQTSPVDTPDEQPDYINAVLEIDTSQPPDALLKTLLRIEAEFGRERPFRNAAKCLDLDLLAYNDLQIQNEEELIVPHPRMQTRAFVLLPLKQICPDWVHPVSGVPISTLIEGLSGSQRAEIYESGAA